MREATPWVMPMLISIRIPACKALAVTRCPLRSISLSLVIAKVLEAFDSCTVMLSAEMLVIVVWIAGAGCGLDLGDERCPACKLGESAVRRARVTSRGGNFIGICIVRFKQQRVKGAATTNWPGEVLRPRILVFPIWSAT